MKNQELICIGCPLGCILSVTTDQGSVIRIAGNTCKKGEIYAKKEMTDPRRIVTSTARVIGGRAKVVSVKTKEDIPKDKIMECMKEINQTVVHAPVNIGDVIIKNVAGTNIAVIATKEVKNS